MTAEQVAQVTEAILNRVRKTLVVKNAHYASGDDKLWNFKTQAKFEGRSPSQVCFSHMMKQVTTLLKATNTPMPLTFGTATEEGILQKPVDIICYSILWICNQIEDEFGSDPKAVQCVIDSVCHRSVIPKEDN